MQINNTVNVMNTKGQGANKATVNLGRFRFEEAGFLRRSTRPILTVDQ